MKFIKPDKNGASLAIKVIPRASRNSLQADTESLRVRLQAPPVDDKANLALIEFLADTLSLPRNRFRLLAGRTSRTKHILILDITPATLEAALTNALTPQKSQSGLRPQTRK